MYLCERCHESEVVVSWRLSKILAAVLSIWSKQVLNHLPDLSPDESDMPFNRSSKVLSREGEIMARNFLITSQNESRQDLMLTRSW